METALKQTAKLMDHVGYRTRLIVLSVLFPGFIIVCEGLAAIWLSIHGTLSFDEVKDLADFIGNKNIVLVLFLSLLLLAASFGIGFIARTFSFGVSDWLIHRGHFPRRSFAQRMDHLSEVYGESSVNPVKELYHVFSLVQRHSTTAAVTKLPRPAEFYIREYCKLWLRAKVPSLCTDHTEIEINVFMSLLIPMGFVALPILTAGHGPFNIGLALAAITVSLLMLGKINESRCYETEQAIVNFLFAHWERLHTRTARAAKSTKATQAAKARSGNGVQKPAQAVNGASAHGRTRTRNGGALNGLGGTAQGQRKPSRRPEAPINS